MTWQAWVLAVFLLIEFLAALIQHGQIKIGKKDGITDAVVWAIIAVLLYTGGFFK